MDLLPKHIWHDKHIKFLDPACKSGVFLREIAKRLLHGLEKEIPNIQERINHIYTKQLYGIAITELTALLSRRSVYCSRFADSKYSITTEFDTPEGNIIFNYVSHEWHKNRCRFCGATKQIYDRGNELETHAYQFIHTNNPEEIFNMKFDIIVGNPPYQLKVGVEKENYAVPLYHLFVQQAKKLNPRLLAMIIPSRWFAGGRGLDEFRSEMLNDIRIRKLVDYPNATDCFPGVDISGGVCYFLWDRENKGDCEITNIRGNNQSTTKPMIRPLLEENGDSFIRFNESIPIIRKIAAFNEPTFGSLVSPQTPFGIISSFKDFQQKHFADAIKIYTTSGIGFIRKNQVLRNQQWINDWKVYIAAAYGERGQYPYRFLGKPFIGEPNSCCTQAYLLIGTFSDEKTCTNVMSYIQTKFFRFCIMLKKNTQHAMRDKYALVPMQDFSEAWTDDKLYKKYNLTTDDIAFIDSMVRPMELSDER
ncbi:Eco57I restriction-modification methylase domain-containing protein [Legionella drancourtii]|uniref:Eco57I restriction-modification methylase domain-containing protein n=1 Tax=Legionella drancourtii TaxID=168933 RepID=UPI0018F27616|nr:Eco57I restriction-modification methylase domain-containing protein [Legionella drancourtii]